MMLIWTSLFFLLLANVVSQEETGFISTSQLFSGVLCGPPPSKRCWSRAVCSSSGLCECPAGTWGNAEFACYPLNSQVAEIIGPQNKLRTYKNTVGNIYWPCRFRLMEFTTFRKRNEPKCHFQMFGSNEIINGKIIMTGMEVHVSVSNDTATSGIGIRKRGVFEKDLFTYKEWGKKKFIHEPPVMIQNIDDYSFSGSGSGSGSGDGVDQDEDDSDDDIGWGLPEELVLRDGERAASKTNDDGFVTFSFPSCKADVLFRPANVGPTIQTHTSGLAVVIKEEESQAAEFANPFTYLAESPFWDVLGSNARKKNIRIEREILHRSMEYAANQYSTPVGLECHNTAIIYREYCDDEAKKVKALNSCAFFLEEPDLVSCLDPLGGRGSSTRDPNNVAGRWFESF